MDQMPWFLGNSSALALYVLGLSAFLLWAFRTRRGEAGFWREIETAATVLGGVSLILLSINIERTFALRYFNGFKEAYHGATSRLTSEATFLPRYSCETQFVKGEYSPKDFDARRDDQAVVCEWSKRVQQLIYKVKFAELDDFDLNIITPPPQKTDEYKIDFKSYRDGAQDYLEFRKKALALKAQSELSDWQLPILAFAPYLLATALALTIAKVR